jgi:hypothetical protein
MWSMTASAPAYVIQTLHLEDFNPRRKAKYLARVSVVNSKGKLDVQTPNILDGPAESAREVSAPLQLNWG